MNHLNLILSNNSLDLVRPVKDWRTTTYVQLDMLLFGILEVDEKFQTITNHIWLQMLWTNEFLTWRPADFCGIDMLTVPRSKLWIPDIGIQEDTSDTSSVQDGMFVSIHHNGTVMAGRRQRLTFTCQLNLKMFPFDTQHCSITFMSHSSTADAVELGTVVNDTTLNRLSERIMITQGEWKLTSVRTEAMLHHDLFSNVSKLAYKVTFERKPMLYVINFIVPLFYLLVLDLTSFFISESRGEKMSFKVTILLSISVLLLILQDMLPSTEDNLPMIAIYCVAIFALVGISVLEAMLVTFLVDLDSYCAVQCSRRTQQDDPVDDNLLKDPAEEKVPVKPGSGDIPLPPRGDGAVLQRLLEEVKAARRDAGKQLTEKKKYKRWAEVFDHVFFVVYFITVTVFLMVMYITWMRNLG
ncbi:5-hydroxytryptamine receptor 3A [Salarias fasciatus]|uniref:5-hydroxytryptamine receptor 3A-like n=1 Tax=Salarias fasciatus TaxID=181472 RepID=A0A672GXP7_SALFA|nr:5-hydroxytryptamine receptor 3A-like [Salarias fasciatus]XP_029945990.1 5-hydroxytryptamine receptor 3A-like [Salarias fasciatus]